MAPYIGDAGRIRTGGLTVLQTAPLNHLGTASLLAGAAGFEPTIPESKSGALPLGYTPILVTRAGFEPVVAAVKGRCPIQLDERAIGRERCPCKLGCGTIHN